MTYSTSFALYYSQEDKEFYHGDFEHSPSKRRRVENDVQLNKPDRRENSFDLITYNAEGNKTSPPTCTPNMATSHPGEHMAAANDFAGWQAEQDWGTPNPHHLAGASLPLSSTFNTELRMQHSKSVQYDVESRPNPSHELKTYTLERVQIKNSVLHSFTTPPANSFVETDQVCYGMGSCSLHRLIIMY